MADLSQFLDAFPYQKNVLALPISDIDSTANWYGEKFGMTEVKRTDEPVPTVILERDGVQIGFAINGSDPAQDGAAIKVDDVERMNLELKGNQVNVGNLQTDERDGNQYRAFFVVAPDGLCFYFHQLIGPIG